MVIRSAGEKDQNRLFELLKQFAITRIPNQAEFDKNYPQVINDPNVFLKVAEIEGNVVGYYLAILQWTFYANGKVVLLQELMMDPDYRGKGIGSDLLKHAIETAKNSGAQEISLFTSRAPDYYPRFGFEMKASYFRLKLTD
jgi:N-acetylglutamate synthase-like GNAT family acetyltransferase